MQIINGNGQTSQEEIPTVPTEQDRARRARANLIRRKRRALRKENSDLHYYEGQYFPVSIHPSFAIPIDDIGDRIEKALARGNVDEALEVLAKYEQRRLNGGVL